MRRERYMIRLHAGDDNMREEGIMIFFFFKNGNIICLLLLCIYLTNICFLI